MEDFFQQHATIPAEMLGDAMHLLNMNPTADEAYFAFCGSWARSMKVLVAMWT